MLRAVRCALRAARCALCAVRCAAIPTAGSFGWIQLRLTLAPSDYTKPRNLRDRLVESGSAFVSHSTEGCLVTEVLNEVDEQQTQLGHALVSEVSILQTSVY